MPDAAVPSDVPSPPSSPSRPAPGPTLADVGEDGLLAAIFPRLAASSYELVGPGDDTAVVAARDGRVVATTDVLVEGRDFRRDWSSPQDVGWKAAAQNLADVAAMGAVPTALLVGLVAPPDLPVEWATGLSDGMSDACAGTGAGVVGGDLSSGPVVVVSVTALGDLQGRAPVLRSGARVGDVVALAGVLGRSAAGWALLRAGRADLVPEPAERPVEEPAERPVEEPVEEPGEAQVAELVEAHRRPRPPYAAGPAAALAGATAMLDVSDGLLRDAGRLARASGVCIDLDDAALGPRAEQLRAVAQALDADPWAWVLGGGEDHGLLATFAPGTVAEGFEAVGSVHARLEGWSPVLVEGHEPTALPGWDHFRP